MFIAMERMTSEQIATTSEQYQKVADQAKKEFDEIDKKSEQSAEKIKKAAESVKNNSNSNTVEQQVVSDEKRSAAKDAKSGDAKQIMDKLAKFMTTFSEEQRDRRKNARESGVFDNADIKAYRKNKTANENEKLYEDAEALNNKFIELFAAKNRTQTDIDNKITEIRIANSNKALDAAINAQNHLNTLEATYNYANGTEDFAATGSFRSMEVNAGEDKKSQEELEKKMIEYRAGLEYMAKKKNNGKLSEEEAKNIEKLLNDKYKKEVKNIDKMTKERQKAEEKAKAKEGRKTVDDAVTGSLSKENNLVERMKKLNDSSKNAAGDSNLGAKLLVATAALSTLIQKLDSTIDEIGGYKGPIDTRLQGSKSIQQSGGSYWDQIVKDMTAVGAINPYFKQNDFANNIKTLVESGIAFDLEQRAFLMTIKDKIATTFNVADASLLKLVRIQQQDTTAGRLGMEAALNSFLNSMYESTEYLNGVADSVRSSLYEMEALMEGTKAAEVEFQVQKWMGSLFSLGMSQEAVNSIASTLGQIAAGQIEGLTNGGTGNLLIMAANDAGISITDILTKGIGSKDTNKLLEAAVSYLSDLADSAKDNKVVQQELAKVFGVKASDLKAATRLVESSEEVFGTNLRYDQMIKKLNSMAGSMIERTSVAEIMTNVWNNVQYSLAGSMASNPISYMLYKGASLLEETTGGISLPFLNVMGFGVDLETTVADLMRVGALAGGIMGSFSDLITGLGNSFSGQSMLNELGIFDDNGARLQVRGTVDSAFGGSTGGGSRSTSGSGNTVAGNSSGSDIQNSTVQEANDDKKKLMVEAKEEAETNQVDMLNTTVLKIYELLDDVASGKNSFKVKVEGYGLTGTNSSGGLSGAQAGVLALNSSAGGNNSVNSGSVSGSIDQGGWVMI
jgi:hypothetical protein